MVEMYELYPLLLYLPSKTYILKSLQTFSVISLKEWKFLMKYIQYIRVLITIIYYTLSRRNEASTKVCQLQPRIAKASGDTFAPKLRSVGESFKHLLLF